MSKFKKEFEFILSEPITYQYELGEKKTDSLTFKAPANKHSNSIDKMRKEIVKSIRSLAVSEAASMSKEDKEAMKKSQKSNQQEDDMQMDGPYFLFMIYGDQNFDLETYREVFWDMIISGELCLLDNKIKLTESLLNDISYDDRTDILGEYSANFLQPSWIKRLKKK